MASHAKLINDENVVCDCAAEINRDVHGGWFGLLAVGPEAPVIQTGYYKLCLSSGEPTSIFLERWTETGRAFFIGLGRCPV